MEDQKKYYSVPSVDSFGSFQTEASDAVASEFRRRLVYLKVTPKPPKNQNILRTQNLPPDASPPPKNPFYSHPTP